jgi:hypothetical protein
MKDKKPQPQMTAYCAWCRKFLRGDKKVPYEDPNVSHGMCDDCMKKFDTTL